MTENQKAYRQIFAATSIFSSVQILNILASIVRSKFAAVLIGPIGIGILGVLNSVINLISGISKIGLDISSVKDIAFANKKGDEKKVNELIFTLKRILWFTGLLGAILTIVLSSVLSEITFNNADYTLAFIWLSIAVLFNQLTVGNLAILQGLRKLRHLAIANLISSFASVIIVVPFYYYLELRGIVPSMIVVSIVTFFISMFYIRNLKQSKHHQSFSETITKGKAMIKLGVVLSINSLISLFVAYIMQVYVTNFGGLTEVGLYNAAIIIINSYVGLVFNAMSKDYYPRLAETIEDNLSINKNVRKQALFTILLLAPIIVLFIAFAPIIIKLIYSKEFLPIITFVSLALIGTLFKALSWSKGYVIIAKGDSKVFIKTAIGFNMLLLILNIIGYNLYGFTGLGVSFIIHFCIHYLVITLIMKFRYNISYDKEVIKVFLFSLLITSFTYAFTFIRNDVYKFALLSLALLLSVFFSVYYLNKKMDLIAFLKKKNND
ncbi:MAG: oligosaccharide flippase family protein [Flavobacteriaceae bacterium]|nr:oligosaccharide flippase family protein [Bacteroidia bacterium]NNK83913.1 oligosaccharide flippase family protein [Flavobacteriaceae bacterium]